MLMISLSSSVIVRFKHSFNSHTYLSSFKITSNSSFGLSLHLYSCIMFVEDVRIRKFVNRFTRFSLEIRKTILFFFWSILKEILDVK